MSAAGDDSNGTGEGRAAAAASPSPAFPVYDRLLEGCLVLGDSRRILYANEALAVQLRRPRESVLGLSLEEVFPGIPHCLDRREPRDDTRAEPARRVDLEVQVRDGSRQWFHLEFHAIAEGTLVLAVDVSRGTDADERFRALVENAPFGIFVQTNRRFAYLNPSAAALFGVDDPRDLVGEPVIEFIAPEFRERVKERIRRLNEDREVVEPAEHVMLRKDGGEVAVEVSAVPIEFGNEHGALVFATDLTERHRVVEERERLEAQLRQSQKMEAIGRLAGGIAHDFNNLLTVILGYSEIAMASAELDDSIRGKLVEIRRAGESAAALTGQLLTFSRQQVLAPVRLDLATVLGPLGKMLGRLLGESVQVSMRLAPRLPLVEADPHQVEQVLLNLAVNARDAMPDGGNLLVEVTEVKIDEVYSRQQADLPPGAYVMLSVTDDGCGMDAATRERIFEPFFTTKDAGKGTGLGLSTVYGIVAQSGGQIRVDSRPGAGTTFRIYLPQAEDGEEGATEAPARRVQRGDESILVVEDQAALRDLVAELLSVAGYQVTSAANAAEALRKDAVHGGGFDLVLTDVVMPGMSGPELVEELRRRHPGLPALFMSGYTDERMAGRGHFDPSRNFLPKPFTAADLTGRIRKLLDDSERTSRAERPSSA